MIEGLPEKSTDVIADGPKLPASAPVDHSAPQARLSDLYEQDVIDFVNDSLSAGHSESETTKALMAHDFTMEEADRIVRAIAKERPRKGVGSRKKLAGRSVARSTEEMTTADPAAQARLTDLYEQEVIDFVIGYLDAGHSESETSRALMTHDFSREEAEDIVRTIAKGRPRSIVVPPQKAADDFIATLMRRFPDMERVESNPGMITVNGIGTTIYGARDHDPATGTYVKTVVFAVFFIPIFCLGAYRVADAPSGGWYFLGKHPLSQAAKTWNIAGPVMLGAAVMLLMAAAAHR